MTHLHPAAAHPLLVISDGHRVGAHKHNSRVEQSPLQGGLDAGIVHNGGNESGLEEHVAIEGKVPHKPGQSCAPLPL